MAELSTSVTGWLLHWLNSHAISGADWAAGICPAEALVEPDGFIEWETFTQLCDRLVEFSEQTSADVEPIPPPALIAREVAEAIFASAPERAPGGDVPIEVVYVEDALSLADELFPELEVQVDIAPDGEVVLFEVQLPADAEDCPAFFEMIVGALEAAPLLLGQEAADVALEIHPDHARYAVRIPSDFAATIPLERDLEPTHAALADAEVPTAEIPREVPREVEPPQAIVGGAFDHSAFIQSLGACTDLDQAGEHLFALLRAEFACTAARVWLAAGSDTVAASHDQAGPARFEFGDSGKPPSNSLRLRAGEALLGRIDLWVADALCEEELERLELLAPWYALAFRALKTGEAAGIEQDRAQLLSIIQNSSDLVALSSLNGALLSLNTSGQRLLGLASDEEARTKTLYDFVIGKVGDGGKAGDGGAAGNGANEAFGGFDGFDANDDGEADDAHSMMFDIMPSVHRRGHWSGELRLRHFKTGERLTTLANLFVVGDPHTQQPRAIAMICRDLSERRESALALHESQERYRMLADNPYDLIMELDAQARCVYANPNFESLLGHQPETLLGSLCSDLIHPKDRDATLREFSTTLAALGTTRGSFRVLHRDGSTRWLDTTLRAYRGADSRTMAVLISRDISESVESRGTRKQTEQNLQESQKMEAIGRMAGGIAHDFNNLLTAITGYCDLLLDEVGATHPARADAEEILKASERAAALTHQLLAFSRREVLEPRVLDLNNLVADMDRMIRRLIGEDIEFVTVLDGAAWPVKADPGQLQQVLLNLVVNARDAMPRGGRITVETANTTLKETIQSEIDPIPAGEYLTLSVRDTGTGMTPEIRAMIFEPFFTTKQSGVGTGLGLSTVIGIVHQSAGQIRVESEPGGGSRFAVYLPRVQEVPMLPERALSSGKFRGDETILVIEDSAAVREVVVRCLERHGYRVLGAASGVEALRHCNRHTGPIGLLLSDVILPRMDGFEIAAQVREIRPDTRVIYMSGFTDYALAKHDVRAQDVVLLEKPFAPSTLLRRVREFLDSDGLPDK